MESSNRKAEILDASMKVVCEYGLSSFTAKKVAAYMGISESLIYKYFVSKDKLLYNCFEVVHKKVAALMGQIINMPVTAEISEVEFIRQMWYSYFNLLVEEDYRTIFYFSYRDSKYIDTVLEHNDEAVNSYFSGFAGIVDMFDNKYNIFKRVDSHLVWTYILDTTGIFAKRTIVGDLPKSSKNTDDIWRLIFGGICGIINI